MTTSMQTRTMSTALWVSQGLVFSSFCVAAAMKLAMPIAHLAGIWPWTGELPAAAVRLLGFIDLLGGIGVLLPWLTRIKPGLTVAAAWGCVLLQLCAVVFHATRGEFKALPVNVVLIALCVFIAWGRRATVPVVRSARARPGSFL